MSKKRNWSKEEKLAILEEVQRDGLQVTLRKHGIYPATYYNWRKKFAESGESGLDPQARRRVDGQRIRALEDEVSLLKELLADKEMEIALRDDLLKKSIPGREKRNSPPVHAPGIKARPRTGGMRDKQASVLSSTQRQKARSET